MERRKEIRIKIKSSGFITGGDSTKKIGRIVDISHGGLGFHYLETTFIPEEFSYMIGIQMKAQNLFLPDILANTISDFQVQYKTPFKHMPLRRRGIQFCRLSPWQYSQIHSAYCNLLPGECTQADLHLCQPQFS
jgi:c-di-GMP-binding flagellar brake protein YcgR